MEDRSPTMRPQSSRWNQQGAAPSQDDAVCCRVQFPRVGKIEPDLQLSEVEDQQTSFIRKE